MIREAFSDLFLLISFQRMYSSYLVFCDIAFPGSFDRCHFPSKEQKDALLREVRKTDPDYSSTKLMQWFRNRRLQESKKEQKGGKEDALLDPTTSLARESRPSVCFDTHLMADCTS